MTEYKGYRSLRDYCLNELTIGDYRRIRWLASRKGISSIEAAGMYEKELVAKKGTLNSIRGGYHTKLGSFATKKAACQCHGISVTTVWKREKATGLDTVGVLNKLVTLETVGDRCFSSGDDIKETYGFDHKSVKRLSREGIRNEDLVNLQNYI